MREGHASVCVVVRVALPCLSVRVIGVFAEKDQSTCISNPKNARFTVQHPPKNCCYVKCSLRVVKHSYG